MRQIQDDGALFRYRWPSADAYRAAERAAEEASELLVAAGFAPDFSGPGGFAVRSNAFYWDDARTRRLFVTSPGPGLIDLHLHSGRDRPALPALPTLLPPENAELAHSGGYPQGYPQEVTFASPELVQALLGGWCVQIASQGWREDGRRLREWGAFAKFCWPVCGRILTLSLTQTVPGQWWSQLNATARTAPDLPQQQG